MQSKLGIQPILSGILTMTGLYSVNLFVMGGRSNIAFFDSPGIFHDFAGLTGMELRASKIYLIALLDLAAYAAVAVFFKTKPGIAIRATGDNEEMVRSSSINADNSKLLGFCIANALVALSGGLLAQYQSSVDVGYGSGMVVSALASVVIGDVLFGRRGPSWELFFSMVGAVIYRILIAFALKVEILPAYGVKLASALIVMIAITAPKARDYLKGRARK